MRPSVIEFVEQSRSCSGLFVTKIYRIPAAIVAWMASRLGVGPNLVSFISFGLSICGCLVLVVRPEVEVWGAVLAFSLLSAGYILDCADGQLARACNLGTKLGAWIDHTLDCLKLVLVHGSIGWFALSNGGDIPMAFGYLAMVVNLSGNMIFFFGWNYKTCLMGGGRTGERSAFLRLLFLPMHLTDYGLFLLILLLLPWPLMFLTWYFVYGCITSVVYVGYLVFSGLSLRNL